MAMPENILSTTSVPAQFVGARALAVSKRIDYEDGPKGIQDPSEGSQYQVWRAMLVGNQVLLSAPNTPEYVFFEAPDLEEVSITFDQNARYVLAYVQAGQSKLLWFDTVEGEYVTTTFPAGTITPRVSLDDRRASQLNNSDVIVGYVRGGNLYYRQQRDRFEVERLLTTGVRYGLLKVGISRKMRFQYALEVGR